MTVAFPLNYSLPTPGRVGQRAAGRVRVLGQLFDVLVSHPGDRGTCKISGLHRNDFIMAAKTDALAAESCHGTRDEIREKRVP